MKLLVSEEPFLGDNEILLLGTYTVMYTSKHQFCRTRKGWEGKRVSHDHITFLFQRFDELFKNDRVVDFLSIVIFRSFDGECTSVLDQE